MMDPVEQVLAQGRTQESSQNFADYYVKGRQLSQQDQQINLSQQHLLLAQQQQQNENARQPGLLAHIALTNENEQTRNKVDLLNLNNLTDANKSVPGFLQLENRFMQSPDGFSDKSIWKDAIALGQQYPGAAAPGGPLDKLINLGKADVMAKHQVSQLFAAQDMMDERSKKLGLTSDRYVSSIHPDGTIQVSERLPRQTVQPGTLSPAGKATEDALFGRGITQLNPSYQSEYAKEFDVQQQRIDAQNNVSIRSLPGGGFEYIKGLNTGQGAAEVQKLKEHSLALTDSAKQIQGIMPHLADIYGPKATLSNFVVDKSLANLNPDLAVGSRIAGREAAKYIYQGVLRALNNGQRVNLQEQKLLEDTFPALNGLKGMHESPKDAEIIFQQLQKQVARDAYVKMRSAGQRPDPETLQFLAPAFVMEEVKAGRITFDEANAALNASPFKQEAEALVPKP